MLHCVPVLQFFRHPSAFQVLDALPGLTECDASACREPLQLLAPPRTEASAALLLLAAWVGMAAVWLGPGRHVAKLFSTHKAGRA